LRGSEEFQYVILSSDEERLCASRLFLLLMLIDADVATPLALWTTGLFPEGCWHEEWRS